MCGSTPKIEQPKPPAPPAPPGANAKPELDGAKEVSDAARTKKGRSVLRIDPKGQPTSVSGAINIPR